VDIGRLVPFGAIFLKGQMLLPDTDSVLSRSSHETYMRLGVQVVKCVASRG